MRVVHVLMEQFNALNLFIATNRDIKHHNWKHNNTIYTEKEQVFVHHGGHIYGQPLFRQACNIASVNKTSLM